MVGPGIECLALLKFIPNEPCGLTATCRTVATRTGAPENSLVKRGGETHVGERLSKWHATKAAVKVTPKASCVPAFVIKWAVAMWDEGVEEFRSRATAQAAIALDLYLKAATVGEICSETTSPA